MSPVSLSSGPCNDPLGGGEALVTDPATNYRSFTPTSGDHIDIMRLMTSDHTSYDLETPGSWGHCQHQTQETLAETLGMQTPHRNPEYSSDIQM